MSALREQPTSTTALGTTRLPNGAVFVCPPSNCRSQPRDTTQSPSLFASGTPVHARALTRPMSLRQICKCRPGFSSFTRQSASYVSGRTFAVRASSVPQRRCCCTRPVNRPRAGYRIRRRIPAEAAARMNATAASAAQRTRPPRAPPRSRPTAIAGEARKATRTPICRRGTTRPSFADAKDPTARPWPGPRPPEPLRPWLQRAL